MIFSRALWVSLIVGVGLAGALSACAAKKEPASVVAQCYGLSGDGVWRPRGDNSSPNSCFTMDDCSGGLGYYGGGCFKWATSADAPGIPWAELGIITTDSSYTTAPAGAAACYEKRADEWKYDRYLTREAQCFQRDHCSGGLGEGGRDGEKPCFKWATGPQAPPLRWSAMLINPRLAADMPPPREIYEAGFEQTSDDCVGPDCNLGAMRVAAATSIRTRYEPDAPIVARIAAAECVLIETSSLLEVRRRGVVLETFGAFTAGDVIYHLAYDGEGASSVWRRGETLVVGYDDTPVVRWDPMPATPDPRAGVWFKLQRANGQSGWAKKNDADKETCDFVRR